MLSSDSETDSDSDDSVIYIGTYTTAQRPSDQRKATGELSEETAFGDHDERFRDYFRFN